jgi:hypothetical protein
VNAPSCQQVGMQEDHSDEEKGRRPKGHSGPCGPGGSPGDAHDVGRHRGNMSEDEVPHRRQHRVWNPTRLDHHRKDKTQSEGPQFQRIANERYGGKAPCEVREYGDGQRCEERDLHSAHDEPWRSSDRNGDVKAHDGQTQPCVVAPPHHQGGRSDMLAPDHKCPEGKARSVYHATLRNIEPHRGEGEHRFDDDDVSTGLKPRRNEDSDGKSHAGSKEYHSGRSDKVETRGQKPLHGDAVGARTPFDGKPRDCEPGDEARKDRPGGVGPTRSRGRSPRDGSTHDEPTLPDCNKFNDNEFPCNGGVREATGRNGKPRTTRPKSNGTIPNDMGPPSDCTREGEGRRKGADERR